MARKCKRKKTITILQKYGPAKKMRVCASYTTGRSSRGGRKLRRRRRTRRHSWCVFKGKGKSAAKQTCHTSKRKAKHAAAVMRKGCRSRIRIRKVKHA